MFHYCRRDVTFSCRSPASNVGEIATAMQINLGDIITQLQGTLSEDDLYEVAGDSAKGYLKVL
jgi:hypothetical protein